MQVQGINSNKTNCNRPSFRGELKVHIRGREPIQYRISQAKDEILYNAFIKAIGMDYYGVSFGLSTRDDNYKEYIKKLKELSGIGDKILSVDNRKMYSYFRTNSALLNERSYQIDINKDKGIILEHLLMFKPKK